MIEPGPIEVTVHTRPLPYASADATASAASCTSTNVPPQTDEHRQSTKRTRHWSDQDQQLSGDER
jgi:hypothetical protein